MSEQQVELISILGVEEPFEFKFASSTGILKYSPESKAIEGLLDDVLSFYNISEVSARLEYANNVLHSALEKNQRAFFRIEDKRFKNIYFAVQKEPLRLDVFYSADHDFATLEDGKEIEMIKQLTHYLFFKSYEAQQRKS